MLDLSRAHVHAKSRLRTQILAEDSHVAHVGKVLRTLYDIRDAANAGDEFFNIGDSCSRVRQRIVTTMFARPS